MYTIPAAVPMPDIAKTKRRRKRRTVAAGVIGGAAGLVLLGPIGAIVLGTSSALITKSLGKRKERKRMKKYYRKVAESQSAAFEHTTTSAQVATAVVT